MIKTDTPTVLLFWTERNDMLRALSFFISIYIISFPQAVFSAEPVPDDIRYMLEDMYGENKNKWPSPRYQQDLNNDGRADWIVIKKGCLLKEKCAAELFICIPNKKGVCLEYCYMEVKNLVNVEDEIKKLKCESTC